MPFKEFVRGQYISAIAAVQKGQKTNTRSLQIHLELQKEIYGSDSNTNYLDILMDAQRDLHLPMNETIKLGLYKNRQTFRTRRQKWKILGNADTT